MELKLDKLIRIEPREGSHPINEETRKMFEDLIFEEYNKGE